MTQKMHWTTQQILDYAHTLDACNDSNTDRAILRTLLRVLADESHRPQLTQWQCDTIHRRVVSMVSRNTRWITEKILAIQVLGALGDPGSRACLEERLKVERHDEVSNAIRNELQKKARNDVVKKNV